jgi:hypothetical protein
MHAAARIDKPSEAVAAFLASRLTEHRPAPKIGRRELPCS